MSRVTNVMTTSQQEYRPSIWAVLLHQVPHVNITFHRIHDDSFRPESEIYLESLGIIGSVPAAWLILTLILLLIYLLTRCCDTKNNKKRKSRPVRCCLSFFSLVCIAALGAGFWGNHLVHEETDKFVQATQQMARLVDHAQTQAQKFNDVLSQHVMGNANNLYDGPFQKRDPYKDEGVHRELKEKTEFVLHNISHGLKNMDKVRLRIRDRQDKPITFKQVPKRVDGIETIRWPVTMCFLGVCSLFCLLLFIGAIIHSRGTLIVFSVCGLFSIIVLWLLAAIYITLAVAIADFCTDPKIWMERSLKTRYDLSPEISDYYLACSPTKTSPFQEGLEEAQRAVMSIDTYVKSVSSISRTLYSDTQLNPQLDHMVQASQQTIDIMGELNNSLKCDQLYRLYNSALVAACDQGLFGLVIMMISAALCALVFTVLVWCNSHTWIYFKHKGKYVKVEDQDPYMPLSTIDRGRASTLGPGPPTYQRSRTIHTPPQTPPYHGTLNGHSQPKFPGKNGTMDGMGNVSAAAPPPTIHAGVGYGHIGTLNRGKVMGGPGGMPPGVHGGMPVGMHGGMPGGPGGMAGTLPGGGHHPGHQGFLNPGHNTLGRQPMKQNSTYSTYGGAAGMGGPSQATTMTLGRKGHYASLRSARAHQDMNDLPMLGPNQGQYATLSKGCKTLESSDFY